MRNIVVVGTQWGDEGKGKLVDLLAPHFDIVARYQGGHNAGHTVWIDGRKFVLHLVPSGILHEHCACVIGNGVVIDVHALVGEIERLRESGISVDGRLMISSRAHLILSYHREVERASEERLGGDRVGTTMRGIGPTYEDKVARRGVRVGDLLYPDLFREKVRANVAAVNEALSARGSATLDAASICDEYLADAARLAPFVTDTARYLNEAVASGKSILLEGAQATMLDIDHGTYPYVTSSSSTAGGACTGTGLAPTRITGVLGISKAYTTRVGAGPFPTELEGDLADHLRERGSEYGASTGRPRRVGWFDAPVARYSAMLNGLDTIALTKLDVLDDLDELKICVAYRMGGERIEHVPDRTLELAKVEPIYENFPGWKTSTREVSRIEDLPDNARRYVDALAALTGVEIGMVSTGPDRAETILRPDSKVAGWLEKDEGTS
jgi:adenylosuccinate synthase